MPDQTFKFDVFLSHNSKDKPAVEQIARVLRDDYGVESWLDKWNLIPGDSWMQAIEEALEKCETFAVFVGPSGIGPWENPEMQVALDTRVGDRKRRVIPVLLPGAPSNKELKLPALLRQLTWADFREGLDDKYALYLFHCGITGKRPGDKEMSSRPLGKQKEDLGKEKVAIRTNEINQSSGINQGSNPNAEQPRTVTSSPPNPSSDEPRTIHLKTLEKLGNHQGKLKNYVEGYLMSSERWAECGNAKSILVERGINKFSIGQTLSASDWESIRSAITSALTAKVLPDELMFGDLQNFAQIFIVNLEKAQQAVQKVARSSKTATPQKIENALNDAMSYINNAIDGVKNIIRICGQSATKEIAHIESLIDMIVGPEKSQEPPKAIEVRMGSELGVISNGGLETRQAVPVQR